MRNLFVPVLVVEVDRGRRVVRVLQELLGRDDRKRLRLLLQQVLIFEAGRKDEPANSQLALVSASKANLLQSKHCVTGKERESQNLMKPPTLLMLSLVKWWRPEQVWKVCRLG